MVEGSSKKFSSSPNVAPSTKVIEAIADFYGTDPITLNEPLYETIDPDALDAVISSAAAGNNGSGRRALDAETRPVGGLSGRPATDSDPGRPSSNAPARSTTTPTFVPSGRSAIKISR
jgi:hypothetical protein